MRGPFFRLSGALRAPCPPSRASPSGPFGIGSGRPFGPSGTVPALGLTVPIACALDLSSRARGARAVSREFVPVVREPRPAARGPRCSGRGRRSPGRVARAVVRGSRALELGHFLGIIWPIISGIIRGPWIMRSAARISSSGQVRGQFFPLRIKDLRPTGPKKRAVKQPSGAIARFHTLDEQQNSAGWGKEKAPPLINLSTRAIICAKFSPKDPA